MTVTAELIRGLTHLAVASVYTINKHGAYPALLNNLQVCVAGGIQNFPPLLQVSELVLSIESEGF
jgi:hypothetical protein